MKHGKQIVPILAILPVLFFAFLLVVFPLEFVKPGEAPDATAPLALTAAKQENGTIDGNVIVRLPDGNYSVYFADNAGKAIAHYPMLASVEVKDGSGAGIVSEAFVPVDASKIVCIGEDGSAKATAALPANVKSQETLKYTFGVISDVHYNKYFSSTGKDDAVSAVNRAYSFYDTTGISLLAVTGDISNVAEEDSYAKFASAMIGHNFPTFAVTGNHDVDAVASGLWASYMNKALDSHKANVITIADNGIDFVYTPTGYGDEVFIFLSQTKADYWEGNGLLSAAQITWLDQTLALYKDANVYLVFHTFVELGSAATTGNIVSPTGFRYNQPYPTGTFDCTQFNRLLAKYPNVTFFSGHSHWMFEMECYNEDLNTARYGTNKDGAMLVHVPSVTAPRYIGAEDTEYTGKNGTESQGWLVYVCDDSTVYMPIDFMTGEYMTEYAVIEIRDEAAYAEKVENAVKAEEAENEKEEEVPEGFFGKIRYGIRRALKACAEFGDRIEKKVGGFIRDVWHSIRSLFTRLKGLVKAVK